MKRLHHLLARPVVRIIGLAVLIVSVLTLVTCCDWLTKRRARLRPKPSEGPLLPRRSTLSYTVAEASAIPWGDVAPTLALSLLLGGVLLLRVANRSSPRLFQNSRRSPARRPASRVPIWPTWSTKRPSWPCATIDRLSACSTCRKLSIA